LRSQVFADSVLDERASVVTGGGTGLGKAAARELAACGAKVVLAGRREEVLAAAAAEIGDATSYVVGDVRDPESAKQIVRTCLERHGRLDILVNNAGGQFAAPLTDTSLKGLRAVHRLNVDATWDVTTRFSMSMSVTSPRSTRVFFCRASTSRIAGATSPADSTPVATW